MQKKIFMGVIACAALTVTSCSNDEIVDNQSSKNAIEFGTYIGRNAQMRADGDLTASDVIGGSQSGSAQSNGMSMTNDNLNKFGVFASYTGAKEFDAKSTPNFMYNQEVTKSGSAWTYNPVKYWPTTAGDKISFFAYAPFGNANVMALSSSSDVNAPKLTVTLPTDNMTKMVDFVAGNAINQTHDGEKTVKFNLQHELTRVSLQAKVNQAIYATNDAHKKTHVVIKSIQFDKTPKFSTKGVYTFATTTGTRGTWETTAAEHAITLDDNILNNGTVTIGKYSETHAIDLNADNNDGTKVTNLLKDNDYLFLIPVNGGSGLAADDNMTVTISYDIVTEDNKLATGYSLTSATKKVTLAAGTLKQGLAYGYTFVIGVDEVTLDAEIRDWDFSTTNEVNVNYGNVDAHN